MDLEEGFFAVVLGFETQKLTEKNRVFRVGPGGRHGAFSRDDAAAISTRFLQGRFHVD